MPVLSYAAQRLYAQFAHLEFDRPEDGYSVEAEGWPMATACAALAAPLDPLYELVAVWAQPWMHALDVDETPAFLLPWLAQFRGVVLPLGLTDAQARGYIRVAAGQNRGSNAALRAAAMPLLIGQRRVIVRQRVPDDGHITVITYLQETPEQVREAVRVRLEAATRWQLLLVYIIQDLRNWSDSTAQWGTVEGTWGVPDGAEQWPM